MNGNSPPQPHLIQPAETSLVKLVQITDCHIFADAKTCLLGMNTRNSFEAVCQQVTENHSALDALLATGDLSQDGSAESYQYLAEHLDGLGHPVFWLPGNHDDYDTMTAHFQADQIHPTKQLVIGNWQIILLDSTIKGEVHGRVASAQLDFLDHALQEFPDKHALVCLHHQAIDTGSRWIDLKGLHDSAQLRKQLARHRHVKGVLWGHVHQEAQRIINGVKWMSTPSTCIQFKPSVDEFCLDNQAPGYRILSLGADGNIDSSVTRIDFEFELEQD